MKRILLFTMCLTAIALAVFGEDAADYQKWMKTIGATSGSLRKNLDAKDGDAASADAKKLQAVFDEVHMFWHMKNADDAMMFAMNARDAFRDVASQAAAGKVDEASTTLKKAMTACSGCHAAHREKATDGSWKIK